MVTTETITSTEATPELGTLTAEDVRALNLADSVCFHLRDGGHYIRAYAGSLGRNTIFTAAQQRVFNDTTNTGAGERARHIATAGNACGYGADTGISWSQGWGDEAAPHAACFHMISSARFHDKWITLASLFRAGDVITLRWTADTYNPRHGIHVDDLDLVINRGKRRMTLLLARTAGEDNTARMIRRYG